MCVAISKRGNWWCVGGVVRGWYVMQLRLIGGGECDAERWQRLCKRSIVKGVMQEKKLHQR